MFETCYINNLGGKVWLDFWLWSENNTNRQILVLTEYDWPQNAIINQIDFMNKIIISNIADKYHLSWDKYIFWFK